MRDSDACGGGGRTPTLTSLAEKQRQWEALLASRAYEREKLVADAWCAAFLWPKGEHGAVFEAAPTTDAWLALRDRQVPPSSTFLDATRRIVEDYGLFHWELAFPDVFARGGFDVVLGQPARGSGSNSRNRSSSPSASRPSRRRGTPPNERSSSRRFQPRTRFSGRSGRAQRASHRDRAISHGNPGATRFVERVTSIPMRCLRNTIGECWRLADRAGFIVPERGSPQTTRPRTTSRRL